MILPQISDSISSFLTLHLDDRVSVYRVFQKTQKFKFQKKQIIFPLDYINEHSMPNFSFIGCWEAFPQMALNFTKESP